MTITKVLGPDFGFHGYLTATSGVRVDSVTSQIDFLLQDVRSLVESDGVHLYKYLLLDVSAGWCNPCNQEAQDLGLQGADSGKIAEWLGKGGVVLTVLVEGYDESSHAAPLAGDITTWLNAHQSQHSLALDMPQALDSVGLNTAAFPYNAVINLQTMTIDDAWYGVDTTYAKWENELAKP